MTVSMNKPTPYSVVVRFDRSAARPIYVDDLDLTIEMLEKVNAGLDGGWLPYSHTASIIAGYIQSIPRGRSARATFALQVSNELDWRRHRYQETHTPWQTTPTPRNRS